MDQLVFQFNKKKIELTNLSGPKASLWHFLAFLAPWGHIWDIMGLANGTNWPTWMSSVLF